MRQFAAMWTVGDVIRKLRIAQGLTIPQLAKEAAISTKTISKIERGDTHVYAVTLGAIAKALGLRDHTTLDAKCDEWCEARLGPRRVKSEFREVLELWAALSLAPEAQRMMLMLLRREVQRVPHPKARSRDPETPATRGGRSSPAKRSTADESEGRHRARINPETPPLPDHLSTEANIPVTPETRIGTARTK